MLTTTTGTMAGRLVPGVIYISKRERERERERERTAGSLMPTFSVPAQASRRQIERARTSTTTPGTTAGRLAPDVVYISKRERERERERENQEENYAWLTTPCTEFSFV